MHITRFLISIITLTLIFSISKGIRMNFTKYCYRFKGTIRKIYRIINVKNRSKIVWKELIKLHKESEWKFGQYDNQKYIVTTFHLEDNHAQNFRYAVTSNNLEFHTFLLKSFDEEKTNDILVLSAHFNGLLNFGKVSVSTKHNYVEFIHSGDLVTYMLYPGEIHTDLKAHYNLTKDCYWAFSNLIETGEDPVFVFSELLRRKEEDAANQME